MRKLLLPLLLATLLLLLAPARAAGNGCDGLSEARCDAAPACVWCAAAAVPSACYTTADAAKLPPGVFQCGKKSEPAWMGVS